MGWGSRCGRDSCQASPRCSVQIDLVGLRPIQICDAMGGSARRPIPSWRRVSRLTARSGELRPRQGHRRESRDPEQPGNGESESDPEDCLHRQQSQVQHAPALRISHSSQPDTTAASARPKYTRSRAITRSSGNREDQGPAYMSNRPTAREVCPSWQGRSQHAQPGRRTWRHMPTSPPLPSVIAVHRGASLRSLINLRLHGHGCDLCAKHSTNKAGPKAIVAAPLIPPATGSVAVNCRCISATGQTRGRAA